MQKCLSTNLLCSKINSIEKCIYQQSGGKETWIDYHNFPAYDYKL